VQEKNHQPTALLIVKGEFVQSVDGVQDALYIQQVIQSIAKELLNRKLVESTGQTRHLVTNAHIKYHTTTQNHRKRST
jgi:hypothetical protein